jgi:hypothetical protein
MVHKMLETSESTGMEYAERHPVGGVVLTKITLEDEKSRPEEQGCRKVTWHCDFGVAATPHLHQQLFPLASRWTLLEV